MAQKKSNPVSEQEFPKNASLKVVSPLGDETVEEITMAPRLDSLEGKTICLVANDSFKSNVTLSMIAESLSKNFTSTKVIPYTDMPRSFNAPPPGTMTEERTALEAALRAKSCDAVITGNGG
jgi:hypothetical protein